MSEKRGGPHPPAPSPRMGEGESRSDGGEGFKLTELGDLPADWELVRLGDVAAVKYGKANPKKDGSIPVVGSGGIYDWTDEPLADFPTLVVGRKGTAGQVQLFKQPCWPSDTTFFLDWNTEIEIDFLFGFMTLHPLSGDEAKTTLPSLKRPDLENYPIPLPPLDEQRKIAHVLNTVQQSIAEQDDLIAAAQELKRSLMRRLFTTGPGPEPAPTKETDIGEVPEHWEVVQLEQLIGSGPQNGLYKPQKLYGSGTPIIRINDYDNDGKFFHTAFQHVQLNADEIERYLLQPRDILVNRVNSLSHLGKSVIIPELREATVFESNMMRFSIDDEEMLPEFAILSLTFPRKSRGSVKRKFIV